MNMKTGAGFPSSSVRILALFLFFSLFPFNPISHAGEGQAVIESTGVAAVAGNPAAAREAALADALRKAVEQAAGLMVSADTLVENYQVINDSVYTRSQGYVKGYAVTGEGQSQGLYQVRVRATVATGDLSKDLEAMGVLQRKAERPRVLFMIAEKSLGARIYRYWWAGPEFRGEVMDLSASETALKEEFLKKGFSVVDANAASGVFTVSDAFRIADLTAEGAREIGRVLSAEIVVYGRALAEEAPNAGGAAVGTYLADITAQAVRVDDGVVLASGRGHGIARHISEKAGPAEALSRASVGLADSLSAQITKKWSGPQPVFITLKNADYRKAAEFKGLLKSRVPGIEAVYQRRFAGGEASFEAESRATAQLIADSIARLGGYKVTGATQNTIEVEAGD